MIYIFLGLLCLLILAPLAGYLADKLFESTWSMIPSFKRSFLTMIEFMLKVLQFFIVVGACLIIGYGITTIFHVS